MKKLLPLLLVLCLICGMVACGTAEKAAEDVPSEQRFEKEGFSILLPADAEDASESESATENPYIFLAGDIIICAIEQSKLDYGYEMTAKEFAEVLVDANAFDCSVETKDGLPAFTFHKAADGLTYLCTTKVTDSSFWFINASCDPAAFEANYDTMWKYLTSVKTYATDNAYAPEDISTFQTITVEDLTIQLPEGAQDVTAQWNTGATFAYMISDDSAVMATREAKSSIDVPVESLEFYCNNLIEVNGLDSYVKTRDDMPYFTYKSDDDLFTYLVTVYEGTDSYWYLQTYTETDMFPLLEARLWTYLDSVQVE